MTLGSHQASVGKTQIHITPRWIIQRLGPFDLDPAAADPRPWACAATNYTERDDGLGRPWFGRVYLNPPFDRYVVPRWIRKLAEHGRGTALLHARTETDWFEPIWESAAAILFLADRLSFYRPDGTKQPANSGAPPVLIAFGNGDAERLKELGNSGRFRSAQMDVAATRGSMMFYEHTSGAKRTIVKELQAAFPRVEFEVSKYREDRRSSGHGFYLAEWAGYQ